MEFWWIFTSRKGEAPMKNNVFALPFTARWRWGSQRLPCSQGWTKRFYFDELKPRTTESLKLKSWVWGWTCIDNHRHIWVGCQWQHCCYVGRWDSLKPLWLHFGTVVHHESNMIQPFGNGSLSCSGWVSKTFPSPASSPPRSCPEVPSWKCQVPQRIFYGGFSRPCSIGVYVCW